METPWLLARMAEMPSTTPTDGTAALFAVISSALVTMLLLGSVMEWVVATTQYRQGELPFAPFEGDRFLSPLWVRMAALAFPIVSLMFPLLQPSQPDVSAAAVATAELVDQMHGFDFVQLVSILVLTSGMHFQSGTLAPYGIAFEGMAVQLAQGQRGFLLAVVPTIIGMLTAWCFRTGPQDQHALILAVREDPSLELILAVGFTVVFVAPLFEELVFRVILQPWAVTQCGATPGLLLVAGVFCAIHGWPDALALLPLSLILGYVFHTTHSYLAVAGIHGLFNATQLCLLLLAEAAG